MVAPVHEVSEEKIVGEWRLSPNFEELQKIKELAMNIPTYGHRSLQLNDVPLLSEDFFGLHA